MHPTEVFFHGTRQPVPHPVSDLHADSASHQRESSVLKQELGPVVVDPFPSVFEPDVSFFCEQAKP
jgi:hypothetical protein